MKGLVQSPSAAVPPTQLKATTLNSVVSSRYVANGLTVGCCGVTTGIMSKTSAEKSVMTNFSYMKLFLDKKKYFTVVKQEHNKNKK